MAAARALGRYVDWEPSERESNQAEMVCFQGDVPPTAGREQNQYRLVLKRAQPLLTNCRDVIYTERGMAWVDGRLERRFSFQEVGPRQIWNKPWRWSGILSRGTILQSQTPCTYGDWMSEHVASLALASERNAIVAPLLLPAWWLSKSYVQRDLAVLGVTAMAVVSPVLIKEATVINKMRVGHYWNRAEAQAVVAAMNIKPRDCSPGTAVYLSRKGEKGEGPKRHIRNDVTEAAMEASGVVIVRTAGRTPQQYMALADSAETLFADHGSASYNMLYWKTRRVVEFFPPDYWDSAFLFLSDALGIHDYHLWQIDDKTTVAGLAARIRELMRQPAGMSQQQHVG